LKVARFGARKRIVRKFFAKWRRSVPKSIRFAAADSRGAKQAMWRSPTAMDWT
jgi:hypothetical protein